MMHIVLGASLSIQLPLSEMRLMQMPGQTATDSPFVRLCTPKITSVYASVLAQIIFTIHQVGCVAQW